MRNICSKIITFFSFKCPQFPLQITTIIQNGQIFLFSLRFIYQLSKVIVGFFIPGYYSFYRIFETLSMLLLAVCSKIFMCYKPKYGYLFTGIVGIIMIFTYVEPCIALVNGESGILFFAIYNTTTLVFMDFLRYFWVMITFEIAMNTYIYVRALPHLLKPGSYDLQNAIFYGILAIFLYAILFYIYITIFDLLENEYKKKEKTFQNWKRMMEKLPLGIIITSQNSILFYNTYVQNLLSCCNLSLSIQSIDSLLTDFDVLDNSKQSKTILAKGKYIFCEKQEIEYNDVNAIVYILNDISPIFEAQQQKEEQHTLEMFVATSTHELRTPLHIIKNTLELMLDDPSNYQADFISKSLNACEMQECYINDILDYAKMKAGKLKLISEPYNIKDILTEIKSAFTAMATESQLTFEVDCPDDKLIISIDYIRFKQILFNLISNALKFTMKG